jgi:hypothetical protein
MKPIPALVRVLLAGTLASPVCSLAQTDEAREDRMRAEQSRLRDLEQQRQTEAFRNEFLSSVGRIPVGRPDRSRREAFRADVRLFHEQVVGFWALRFAPMSERWAREDLRQRSGDLSGTLERMREYVDRDSDPPDLEPAPLPGQNLVERLDRLLIVGLRLRSQVVEVTEGEVLDLGMLREVRSDFATLEAWVRALEDSFPR